MSISVLRSYRRLGLAKKLMVQSRKFLCSQPQDTDYDLCSASELPPEEAMANVYRAAYVMLHVRKSNRAALSLYKDTLGFRIHDTEKGYCAWLPCCSKVICTYL